jgi:hypothetical protein
MRLASIDPGKLGGLALWDGTHATCAVMPLLADGTIDVAEIRAWLLDHGDVDLVVLERQQARPHDGGSSAFATGRGFGELLGLLKSHRLPYELVAAQKWQRTLGLAQSSKPGEAQPKRKKRQKAAHKAYAQRRFPDVELLATSRSRVPHEGMCDALCILEYGRRAFAR